MYRTIRYDTYTVLYDSWALTIRRYNTELFTHDSIRIVRYISCIIRYYQLCPWHLTQCPVRKEQKQFSQNPNGKRQDLDAWRSSNPITITKMGLWKGHHKLFVLGNGHCHYDLSTKCKILSHLIIDHSKYKYKKSPYLFSSYLILQ